jgi:hypothetical protein
MTSPGWGGFFIAMRNSSVIVNSIDIENIAVLEAKYDSSSCQKRTGSTILQLAAQLVQPQTGRDARRHSRTVPAVKATAYLLRPPMSNPGTSRRLSTVCFRLPPYARQILQYGRTIMTRIGWTMTVLVALFLLGASVAPKLVGAAAAVDSLVALGWPTQYLLTLGVIELVLVVLYLVPRTSLLGAVLMTAFIGGAIASHLRAGSPMFSHTLFGVYLGTFIWIALWLRDAGLRAYLAR